MPGTAMKTMLPEGDDIQMYKEFISQASQQMSFYSVHSNHCTIKGTMSRSSHENKLYIYQT